MIASGSGLDPTSVWMDRDWDIAFMEEIMEDGKENSSRSCPFCGSIHIKTTTPDGTATQLRCLSCFALSPATIGDEDYDAYEYAYRWWWQWKEEEASE